MRRRCPGADEKTGKADERTGNESMSEAELVQFRDEVLAGGDSIPTVLVNAVRQGRITEHDFSRATFTATMLSLFKFLSIGTVLRENEKDSFIPGDPEVGVRDDTIGPQVGAHAEALGATHLHQPEDLEAGAGATTTTTLVASSEIDFSGTMGSAEISFENIGGLRTPVSGFRSFSVDQTVGAGAAEPSDMITFDTPAPPPPPTTATPGVTNVFQQFNITQGLSPTSIALLKEQLKELKEGQKQAQKTAEETKAAVVESKEQLVERMDLNYTTLGNKVDGVREEVGKVAKNVQNLRLQVVEKELEQTREAHAIREAILTLKRETIEATDERQEEIKADIAQLRTQLNQKIDETGKLKMNAVPMTPRAGTENAPKPVTTRPRWKQ